MLRIRKGSEPACLAELRRTPGATWEAVHGDQKAELRRAALLEQGFLCAYCMRRIGRTDPKGHPDADIEHWSPRAAGGHLFSWPNLLAVCKGNFGGKAHCDKSKGDQPLSVHPAHPREDVEKLVHFLFRATWEGRDLDGRRREYSGIVLYFLRRAIKNREKRAKRTRGTR